MWPQPMALGGDPGPIRASTEPERTMASITPLPSARHLLRAKDLIDARYREPLEVRTLRKGVLGGLFSTDDCRGMYEDVKSRGVEFTQEPTEQPYGIDAGFRDPPGTGIRMVQRA